MTAESSYRTMREVAEDERPRERLLRHGPGVLSDAELLAVLLGSGTRGENVLDLARRIIGDSGGLASLLRAEAPYLQQVSGLGPAKAALLLAAFEIGRRMQELETEDRPLLRTAEAVFRYLGPRFIGKTKEELLVLSLDTRGRLLGSLRAIQGTVESLQYRPAELFRDAIALDASSIVLVHNHPSGNASPSAHDVRSTRDLMAAGQLLHIPVVDHVVIGHRTWVSIAGLLEREQRLQRTSKGEE
ncbi:MAG: DNA repair protein RadC [Dehalococcoidia bacterium]